MIRTCLRWAMLKLLLAPVYRLGCLRSINPRLVLFASEVEHEPGANFRPLMDRLSAEGYDCRFFSVTQSLSRPKRHLRSLRFLWAYSRARAVFLTESFSPTDACKHRKGTVLVQLWHGCGAFKKFGYSTAQQDWGPGRFQLRLLPMYRHYDYISASAPGIIPPLAEAFGCDPSIIVPWGMPRTDAYFAPAAADESRAAVLAAFPEIGARKIVLYAPTFRGKNLSAARHDGVLDYDAMAQALGDDCALLLKPHPCAKKTIPLPAPEQRPFVFDAASLPIETLLCAADLLISDYSSLVFEYALLGRPMLFYPYDLDEYDRERSFYVSYFRFVPGDLVWATEDMIAGVRRNLFEDGFDPDRVAQFRAAYMSACDGHSTERILWNVLHMDMH